MEETASVMDYRPTPPRAEDTPQGQLLRDTLALSVELILLHLDRAGGPREWHIEAARKVVIDEALLYPLPETAARYNDLARTLAVMAYMPGGVTFLGLHWERKPIKPSRQRTGR